MTAAAGPEPTKHQLHYESVKIPFTLVRTRRRKRSLQISVGLDLEVTVKAPEAYPLKVILEVLGTRGAWIVRQLERVRQFNAQTHSQVYASGTPYYFLGRPYRLKVVQADREEVRLSGSHLEVLVKDTENTARVECLVERWFYAQARAVILDRVEKCLASLQYLEIPAPQSVTLRRMKKRWGSCSKKGGKIHFNPSLVHAPESGVDFVVTHELCHLKHPNHSPAFYAFLTQAMPDWKQRKKELEQALR